MLIVANWKAYVEDRAKAKRLASVAKTLARATGVRIVLAPPAPYLGMIAGRVSRVAYAAQDISRTTQGAATGEATAAAFASAGATYALIGHSERRAAGDTDAIVGEKLVRALAHGLTPILCVGERERDSEGRYLASVREQIAAALSPLSPKERGVVIVAYEPLWAIGKASIEAIHPADLAEMTLYIRKVLAELLPGKSASRALVLYGGSVDPLNARALVAGSSVDGLLVGRASTDPRTFALLVKQLAP